MVTDSSGARRAGNSHCRAARCWALLLVAAVGAARAPGLFRVGLWRDEAATYLYATAARVPDFLALIRHLEANPPGFFYLMYLWMHAFGASSAVIKLPAFAFALVLVWLTYELGERLHSSGVGLCAAVSIAAAPVSNFLALEGRAYTLAACLCTLVAIVYARARRDPSPPVLAALAAAASAALYVHYTAIPFLIAIGAVTAATARIPASTRLRILAALAASALTFGLWIPSFVGQAHAGASVQGQWTAMDVARLFMRDLISLFPGPPVVQVALVAMLAALIIAHARTGRPSAVPHDALPIGLLTTALIASLDWSETRYIYPFAPLLFVCAAAYLTQAASSASRRAGPLLRSSARWALPAVTALLAGVELPDDARFAQTVFSGVPALVREAKRGPPAFYVLAPDYIASTVVYYDRSDGAPALRFAAFGREDHPELFRFGDGYSAIWNSPSLVMRAERRCLREARKSRFLTVVVFRDLAQSKELPMHAKAEALLALLRRDLKEVDRREFSGTVEALIVYRFSLPVRVPALRTGPAQTTT